jgi:hypothetical protein
METSMERTGFWEMEAMHTKPGYLKDGELLEIISIGSFSLE